MTLSGQLASLEAAGLIRLAASQPELEYLFRHALLQDAAYESLIRAERRQLHRTVGQTLERLCSDRLDEVAGVLARHFAQAGDNREAAEYSRRAARQAAAAFAYDEALQQLQAALELTQTGSLEQIRLAVLEELGDVHRQRHTGLTAIPLFQQALDLHASLGGDRLTAVRLNRKIVETLAEVKWTVEVEAFRRALLARAASREGVEAGLRWLQDEPPHSETVRLYVALSVDAWRSQFPPDWETAQHFAQEAVKTAEGLGDPEALSRAMGALCDVLDGRGHLRRQLQVALRRLAAARRPGFNVQQRLESIRAAGLARMHVGEYGAALELLEEAAELARRIHSFSQEFNALSMQSQCYFRMDRWDEVLATEAQWRALAAQHGQERTGLACFAQALSACVRALRGEVELAKALWTDSRNLMLEHSPDRWGRNQHY